MDGKQAIELALKALRFVSEDEKFLEENKGASPNDAINVFESGTEPVESERIVDRMIDGRRHRNEKETRVQREEIMVVKVSRRPKYELVKK